VSPRRITPGSANGVTAAGVFTVVRDSKTSGSQLSFHSVASAMNVTSPFEMVPGIQEFLVPTKNKAAKFGRAVDNCVI
jgi:hypothetical protein